MAMQYCNPLGNTVFVPNSKDTFIHSGLFTVHRGMGPQQRGSWKSKRKRAHTLTVSLSFLEPLPECGGQRPELTVAPIHLPVREMQEVQP